MTDRLASFSLALLLACSTHEVATFRPLDPLLSPGAGQGGAGLAGATSGQAGNQSAGAGLAGSSQGGSGQAGSSQAGSGQAGKGLAGANGGSGAAAAGGASALGVDELCQPAAKASLARLVECNGLGVEGLHDLDAFGSFLRARCVASHLAPGASPLPASFEQCPQALTQASCPEINAFFAGAASPLDAWCASPPGALPDEASCGAHAQCASGLCLGTAWCDSSGCTPTETRCGRCAPRVALGGDCSSHKECQPGLLCALTGQCAAPQAPKTLCDLASPCAPGAHCNLDVCEPTAGLGQPCNTNLMFASCPGPAYCDPQSKACHPVHVALEVGDLCGHLPASQRAHCRQGLACVIDTPPSIGTCQPAPAEGQPCRPDSVFGGSPCQGYGVECVKNTCTRVASLDPASCQ